jgi:hypothetical protein
MGYLVPILLFALAAAVLAAGFAFSGRFRRRRRYIVGVVLVALSLALFWPIQAMYSIWTNQREIYGALALLPLVACLFMFASGVGLISKANNTPRDDYYDNLFS